MSNKEKLPPSQESDLNIMIDQKDELENLAPNKQQNITPNKTGIQEKMELQSHASLENFQESVKKQSDNQRNLRLAFTQKHKKNLRQFDFKNHIPLSDRMSKFRGKVFLWAYCHAKPLLQLQDRTIQHALRIFDKFVGINCINYQVFWEAEMDIITCLLLSAKFCEIYPPPLSDILCITSNPFQRLAILRREIVIFKSIGLNLNISLVSDWYGLYTGNKSLPKWVYMCLIQAEFGMSAQFFEEKVRQIQGQLQKKKIAKEPDMFQYAMNRIEQQRKNLLKKSKLVPRKNNNNKKRGKKDQLKSQ